MTRQIAESDCKELYKQLKLTQPQIDAFETAYAKSKGTITKPDLLKIYSEYSFNAQLLEGHIKVYQSKIKQPEVKKPA
jgi:hypothetical protein